MHEIFTSTSFQGVCSLVCSYLRKTFSTSISWVQQAVLKTQAVIVYRYGDDAGECSKCLNTTAFMPDLVLIPTEQLCKH